MIRSCLIANRGEIAVRVMRTCRRLGIRTVAVYSDADRDAAHVAFADEAVRLGPAPARESYLRPDAILEAALRTGAQAIHPGYGFLSEKPDLPQLCAEAGLAFVGPSADRIVAMGPKIGAKRIAAAAGVPSVPGYAGDEQSTAQLVREAERIGFPLMVKASAGGGGKGMRRVLAAGELTEALDIARREAEAAFGDAALLIERLVLRPRHLEVQVAGDRHGAVVHLFERDCSVQRNNQKLLEEAPAPNLSAPVREKLLARAVALAQAIRYDNLGTVEFILEEGADEPWFLEMNTRLQVEHPVTEAITGFDLVEWQLRIASDEPLPARQDEIRARGHAIEARITAERADQGFRPDAGRILGYREPRTIRVDSGIAAGQEITLYYDSLLAKAIAAGDTREAARARLVEGLRDFTIHGPATTIPFLIDALEHPLFAQGVATTRFLEEAFPEGWAGGRGRLRLARAIAAILGGTEPDDPAGFVGSAWDRLQGFRVLEPAGGAATLRLRVAAEGAEAETLIVRPRPDGAYAVADAVGEIVLALRAGPGGFEVEHGGHVLRGSVARGPAHLGLSLAGERFDFAVELEIMFAGDGAGGGAGSGSVVAAMPGVVAEVPVAVGDRVEVGTVLVVLESMKLFTSLRAEVAGTVMDVACRAGETVAAGRLLVCVDPETA